MKDALVDFKIDGSFTQALKANITANISSAVMNVGGDKSDNPFVEGIRSALSNYKIPLSADIAGSLKLQDERIMRP
jgi:hypothetical protein